MVHAHITATGSIDLPADHDFEHLEELNETVFDKLILPSPSATADEQKVIATSLRSTTPSLLPDQVQSGPHLPAIVVPLRVLP